MFRFLHTSDWHLGRVLYSRSMLEDQKWFLKNSLLPAVDAERPSLVIVAGDVFDRPVAPVEAIRLFNDTLTELCLRRGVKVAVIAGNHDSAERLAVYAELLRPQGLVISARPFDCEPLRFEDEQGPVEVHLLPFFDPAAARDIMGDDSLRGYAEAARAVLGELGRRVTPGARSVVVAHCFVSGASVSDSETPLSIGGSAEIDPALFDAFDYTALGHLHGPQKPGKNVWYSGSPLKYSFDEQRQKKSMLAVELRGEGAAVRRLPVNPLRNMRVVEGTLDEICRAAESDSAREDYIYARLTDRRPVFEPMAALREFYPNVLGLNPGWLDFSENGGAERDALRRKVRGGNVSDRMLFEEFMRQVCGVEPQEDELRLFDEVMTEVNG